MWLITVLIALIISTLTVMVGARVVGARRHGFLACLVALVVSYLIVGVVMRYVPGALVAHSVFVLFLLALAVAALSYMAILGTTWLRGLAVAAIQYVLTTFLVVVLAMVLFGSVMHGVKRMLHDAPFRLDMPAQRV